MQQFHYWSATLSNYPPGSSLPKSDIRLSWFQIEGAVCHHYRLQPEDLRRKAKDQPYLKARQLFRYLLYDEGHSYRQIAFMCNITQMAAFKTIETIQGYIDMNDPYIADLWAIKGALTGVAVSSADVLRLCRRSA